eukprot:2041508-Lingulodinium_polyedra.AAC.1
MQCRAGAAWAPRLAARPSQRRAKLARSMRGSRTGPRMERANHSRAAAAAKRRFNRNVAQDFENAAQRRDRID